MPRVYVVHSRKHFQAETQTKPNLPSLLAYLFAHDTSDENYEANTSLEKDTFLARSKYKKDSWNILGVANYYEEKMRDAEIYGQDGVYMKESLREIVPDATISIEDVDVADDLRFKQLDVDLEELAQSENLQELRSNMRAMLEITEDERTRHKLNTLLKVEPALEFTITYRGEETLYAFKDEIVVQQVLDRKILKRCKQHVSNIKKSVYAIRDKHDRRYLPAVGEVIQLGRIGRKLDFIRPYFKGNMTDIELLERMYSFVRYDDKDNEIVAVKSKNVAYVKITSIYSVEEDWFSEVDMTGVFFRPNRENI